MNKLLRTSWTAAVLATLAAAAPVPSPPQPTDADRRLRAIYVAEWAWRQKEFGRTKEDHDESATAGYLARVGPDAQRARLAYWEKVLKEINAIPAASLSSEERLNQSVFRTIITGFVEDLRFRTYEMPFNSDSSFWAELTPDGGLRTISQYERYIGRMRDVPRYFDEHIANMRAGLERGFAAPHVTLEGRDASIEPSANPDPKRNPFYDVFEAMPDGIPKADRERLQAQGRSAITEAVAPSYAKLLTFMRSEYAPKARATLAAERLPDGRAFYRSQIRQFTTLDLRPQEIHEIGLDEVARIEVEMKAVMAKTGFAGTLPAFIAHLRTDPKFYAKTPDELLHRAAWIAKRIDGEIGNVIGTLPRYRYTIRPVAPEIAPFYTSGRGGLESCYFNTYNLSARPLYNLTALVLHECAPGHSFQAAVALEQPERPDFRRRVYFSGYSEGWGLYTEWLGVGMGLYETPYDDFGRLTYAMWRAARLVIDTGIHHLGWSREQAINYLRDRTALSEHEIKTEIDRYISWPGQALSYKLGELTIRRLRRAAEEKLGPKFDQRRFHDAILLLGSVPLPVLEARIAAFVAEEEAKPREVADTPQ